MQDMSQGPMFPHRLWYTRPWVSYMYSYILESNASQYLVTSYSKSTSGNIWDSNNAYYFYLEHRLKARDIE